MASISFTGGVTIPSTWLNDVNTATYITLPALQSLVNPGAVGGVGTVTSRYGSFVMPAGTTLQRDAVPTQGYLRYNINAGAFEGYNGTTWSQFLLYGSILPVAQGGTGAATAAAARTSLAIGSSWFRGRDSAGQSTTGAFGTYTVVAGDGGLSASTGKYTIPVTGLYLLGATFSTTATAAVNAVELYIATSNITDPFNIGAKAYSLVQNASATGRSVVTSASSLFLLNAGDTVNAYMGTNTGTLTAFCIDFWGYRVS